MSDLLHLVWYSSGPHMLLPMALFSSFLWLSNMPLYIYTNIYICLCIYVCMYMASLMAQIVMNLPTVQETWVSSLGCEDPLEDGMTSYLSSFAWRIPWKDESGRLVSMGLQRIGHD